METTSGGNWHPNWRKVMKGTAWADDPRANDLVLVTRETAKLAMSAIDKQQEKDAYHNFTAATRELAAALNEPARSTDPVPALVHLHKACNATMGDGGALASAMRNAARAITLATSRADWSSIDTPELAVGTKPSRPEGCSKTIFCDPTGPMIKYGSDTMKIADLNPEVETKWRMSRWEMVKLGWRCIVAALPRTRAR
jgi:hypothetical protein